MLHSPPNGRDPLYDPPEPTGPGTKDGTGAGDHDEPYAPRQLQVLSPFPFTILEYARLLALRGRVRDGLFAADDLCAA